MMSIIYGFTYLTEEEIDSWYSKKSKDMSKKEIKRDANGRFAKSQRTLRKEEAIHQIDEYIRHIERENAKLISSIGIQHEMIEKLKSRMDRIEYIVKEEIYTSLPWYVRWRMRKKMKKYVKLSIDTLLNK